MPKIENEHYKNFLEKWVEFTPLDVQLFNERTNQIKYKDLTKTTQVKVLLSIAYWTGLRPAELIELKPTNFERGKGGYYVKVTAKKGGVSGKLFLPLNENTKLIWDYVRRVHPEMYLFYKLYKIKPAKNKVKMFKKNADGSREFTYKIYERHTNNLDKICYKWFGFPIYYFRHNRFSEMILNGATIFDIKNQKLAKTLASVEPYTKFGTKDAQKRGRFLPKLKKL